MNVTESVIERAVEAAGHAPSVHDIQPWRFVVVPPFVRVYLDRERLPATAGPVTRAARMACGAALFTLRIAVEASGHGTTTALLPDPARPDLLAIVRVGGARPVSPEWTTLRHAMAMSIPGQEPFTARPVPPAHRNALVRAAMQERARLVVLDTPKKLDTFATLLRRVTRAGAAHGSCGPGEWVPGGPGICVNPLDRGPLVTMLATHGDDPQDHVQAGLATQHMLLSATVLGLGVLSLPQAVEPPATRIALRTLLCVRGHPQTVLRIGYCRPVGATSRRPVSAAAGSGNAWAERP